jgi:hypothetical protein
MENAMTVFLFFAVPGAILFGALTRSLAGAFLGLALVCVAVMLYLFAQGGMATLGAVLMIAPALICLFLAGILGTNYSYSSLDGFDPSGQPYRARQHIVGEGATQSRSDWSTPTQLPSGNNYRQIGDGR